MNNISKTKNKRFALEIEKDGNDYIIHYSIGLGMVGHFRLEKNRTVEDIYKIVKK